MRAAVRERLLALAYMAPMLVALSIFVLVPVVATVWNGFFLDVTFLERRSVFLDNYLRLAVDPAFWQSLRFTLLFVLVSVPVEIGLGLAFALVLDRTIPGRGALRAVALIPWVIPAAVSGRVFELVYDYGYGLANFLWLGLGGGSRVSWLGSEAGAFAGLVLADAWKTTPFVAIILLAGLAAVPEDLHRQARVDGAHLGQRFSRVTLPLLAPVLVVASLFRTIDGIRLFDVAYVVTGGGPGGSTTPLSLYSYRYFVSGDFGYGSAVSVILFLLSLGLAILYVRLGKLPEAMG